MNNSKNGLVCLFLVLCIVFSFTYMAYAHGISHHDKESMMSGGYMKFAVLGAKHMITGYDHLLFLFGVIFFLTRFMDIVKFITAFTIGHSITLIIATFMKISIDYFLIDAVIALTVIYKGFDNIDGFKKYLNVKAPNLLGLVFVFGLIHGFGLSTRLQQLPLGEHGLLMKIISFNIGVEIGQVIALSIMLVLLMNWRKTESFKRFSTVSNVCLMLAGAMLFFMQMHGYLHTTFADEYKFSDKAHIKSHMAIEEAYISQYDHESASKEVPEVEPEAKPVEKKSHSHGGKHHTH